MNFYTIELSNVIPRLDPTLIRVPVSVPGSDRTPVDTTHLPGLVIFVHGVNSDGEWYDAAEEGLILGLNKRMGLDQALDQSAQLSPASYAKELRPDGKLNRDVKGANFITDHGRSPVIRFRWGYKASGKDGTEGSQDEKEVYGGKIYLNELDAWGGGPFQNGTSALPYMWGDGLDDRVFWWLYANMFPIDGREVYACPPRAYFVHAAHRLKELIKAIRSKQADCPITVVCHSQGNMVTLAAAMLGEHDNALADTYVLCNPPYSLESVTMDTMVNHDARSAAGDFGGITTQARMETFKNFLELVKGCAAKQSQALEVINRYQAFQNPQNGQQGFKLGPFPEADLKTLPPAGTDRDNRGRVFLYCNPHDQVIGVSPVKGMGWQGVSQTQMNALAANGVFHQRVWATPGGQQSPPFAVGAAAWTGRDYHYLDDHYRPGSFWYPAAPRMKYILTGNDRQGFISKILDVLTSSVVYIVTHTFTVRINDEPAKNWSVPINAPVLPEPVTPRSRRYGMDGDFDEAKDPAKDGLAAKRDEAAPKDSTLGGAYEGSGKGDAYSEAALRYEHHARLKREELSRKARKQEFSEEDQRASVRKMLEENPNATDHSTILTNAQHSEKVLAYDVAIGWLNPSKIKQDDMLAFRQFANWMMLTAAVKNLPLVKPFVEYAERGWFEGTQVHRTYTIEHMDKHAGKIKDQRERNLLGTLKG
ncbi:hypothetical protein [Aquabacterium sp.]|uniref:T6SS effector phospholipase Tle3 domain-containing protein n=1 Tax=Aquabacterium sp. TaxID=1872578 RepID=UPI002489E633|nr:hypothetical protein [Aquabacterium sp.]MDI1261560.1 hypothetical protein [Aquabacterium sp.]